MLLSLKVGGGNEVFYRLVNARMFEIYSNSPNINEDINTETGEIVSIKIGDMQIKIGDKFQHFYTEIPSLYTVNKIMKGATQNNYKNGYTILSYSRNKTTSYFLPCLNAEDSTFFDTNGYLINAYIGKDLSKLYLVYRFSTTKFYGKIEQRIVKHPLFISTITSIKDFDVFIYSIPSEHREDVKLFLDGKYSQLSDLLKIKIKNFYKLPEKSFVWKVLTKHKSLVESMEKKFGVTKVFDRIDLDEKPKMEEEIWEMCQFKKENNFEDNSNVEERNNYIEE